MIAFLLLLTHVAHADCLRVVPYKALGSLHIGDAVPKYFQYEKTDIDGALNWANGRGYRVEVTEKGKIDWIQHELAKNECVEMEGKKFTRASTPKELRKAFPNCSYEDQRLGSDLLQCNGFTALWNRDALRIDVSLHDIESLRAAHAASAARYHLDKDSHGVPIPRR